MLTTFLPTLNPATLGFNFGLNLGTLFASQDGLKNAQEKVKEAGLATVRGIEASPEVTAVKTAATGAATAVKGAGEAVGSAVTAIGKGVSGFLTQVIIILILALIGFAVINSTIQRTATT